MPKVATEISNELARQIDRMIRDGWFPDHETVLREALNQFVDAKSFLGDSPRMLHRFAADGHRFHALPAPHRVARADPPRPRPQRRRAGLAGGGARTSAEQSDHRE